MNETPLAAKAATTTPQNARSPRSLDYRVVALRLTMNEASAVGVALDHEDRTEPNERVRELCKDVRRRLAKSKAKAVQRNCGRAT